MSSESFPFVVFIDSGDGVCTGSLIADAWILTAAHCVVESSGKVVHASRIAVERGYPEDYERIEDIGRVVVHPEFDYSGAGFKNDVALIELLISFQSETAVSVQLLTEEERAIYAPSGTLATAIGYGRKENDEWSVSMRQVNILLLTPEDCRQRYAFVDEEEIVHERTLCAGEPGKGVNSGDSGGPLLISALGGWGQVGIASMRGRSESGATVVSVYTRVSSVRDWIVENITDTTELYFPQFAVGPGMTSDIVIFNPSESISSNAEIQFYGGEGERIHLLTAEQSAFTLPPFATFTISPSGSMAGSAVIRSDSPLVGFVRFKAAGLGTVGLRASNESAPRWLIPVRGGLFRTGVAIYNVEDEEVTVSFILMGGSGNTIGSAVRSVLPHGKLLGFLDELLPTYFVPGMEFSGQVLVQTYRGTPGELAVVAVEMGPEQGDFNALPAVPMEF